MSCPAGVIPSGERVATPATDSTTGEVTKELIPRFKTATVFDIAQTVGEPLPTIKVGEIVGSAPEGAFAVLVDFVASIGYTLVPHPDDKAVAWQRIRERILGIGAAAGHQRRSITRMHYLRPPGPARIMALYKFRKYVLR